jgi:transcription antitermination factor NusG
MRNLRGRGTRSADEEFVFLDAISDQATVISLGEFFHVQDDDGEHVEVNGDNDLSDDDLDFIDDLSFISIDSSSSEEEQLCAPSPPRPRPSAGATPFAPGHAPAPVRDLSNSPRTVTAVTNKDFVADDCVDIIGGKYKGKTGTVIKRTPARVQVKLDGTDYNAKKPVDLVPHNISHRNSSRRTGNVNDAKPSSPRTVSKSNGDFVTGDWVDIIGGTYKDKTGTVIKRTPARVQVKLDGSDFSTKKPVNLVPRNVSRRDSTRVTGSVNDAVPHNISRSRRTGYINDAKTSSPRTVSESNDDFVTGDRVDIIGGTYKDKTGTVVKRTPARVQVKLDGAEYSTKKPVNLVPHNVSRRDSTRVTGSVNDPEPALPTLTKFLIPSDMPISSEDADRSVDDEPPQATPAPTPPGSQASATAPAQIESKVSGWLVPGGEDSMLHSSLGGLREDYRRLSKNGKSEKESTFAFRLFGHRIVSFKVPRKKDWAHAKRKYRMKKENAKEAQRKEEAQKAAAERAERKDKKRRKKERKEQRN